MNQQLVLPKEQCGIASTERFFCSGCGKEYNIQHMGNCCVKGCHEGYQSMDEWYHKDVPVWMTIPTDQGKTWVGGMEEKIYRSKDFAWAFHQKYHVEGNSKSYWCTFCEDEKIV